MESVFCTNCGAENDSSKKFCTNCGAPLDKSFLEEEAQPEAPYAPYDEVSYEAVDEVGSDAGFFVSEDTSVSDATSYIPPSAPAPEEPTPSPKRSSTGKVVGITLSVVAAVAVVGFALFYFLNPLGLTTGIFENSAAAQAAAAAEAEEKAAQAQADADAKQAELDKAEEEAQQKEKELEEAQKAQKEAEEAQKEAEEAAKRAEAEKSSSSSSGSSSSSSGGSSVYVGSNGIEYTHHMKKYNSTDFILPQSDTKTYSNSELEALSNWELYVARNEVFARYGRKYAEDSLSTYLNNTDWYQPLYDGSTFDEVMIEDYMNEHEYKNVMQMLDIERSRDSEYLSY